MTTTMDSYIFRDERESVSVKGSLVHGRKEKRNSMMRFVLLSYKPQLI